MPAKIILALQDVQYHGKIIAKNAIILQIEMPCDFFADGENAHGDAINASAALRIYGGNRKERDYFTESGRFA
jgi:hypothetical protein